MSYLNLGLKLKYGLLKVNLLQKLPLLKALNLEILEMVRQEQLRSQIWLNPNGIDSSDADN